MTGGYSMMDFVRIVNRTTGPLHVTFDGVQRVLEPGYRLEAGKVIGTGERGEPSFTMLPAPFGDFAKRQNPNMGTEDPENPRDFEALVGVIEWNDPVTPLVASQAEERLDRSMLDEEAQTARTFVSKIGRRQFTKANRRSRFVDAKLTSPVGELGVDGKA